jgi:hypothetical protein
MAWFGSALLVPQIGFVFSSGSISGAGQEVASFFRAAPPGCPGAKWLRCFEPLCQDVQVRNGFVFSSRSVSVSGRQNGFVRQAGSFPRSLSGGTQSTAIRRAQFFDNLASLGQVAAGA